MRPNFFHHLHPPTIPAKQARLRYTLAAGGLAVFLGLVLLVTGLLEMFYYIPTPDQAALSIQTLTFLVPFGGLVRNLHFWAAQFLVIVSVVHLLRVILTGAYAPPRRFNYLLGMGLLVLAVLLDFTGYVLRWDEGIHWALVTGTNLVKSIPLLGNVLYRLVVGGTQPGPATLIRFYGWHIFGLTLAAGILVTWHIFRVRRDGGIAVPPPPCAWTKPASRVSSWYGGKCWRCCWREAGCCCWPRSHRHRWLPRSIRLLPLWRWHAPRGSSCGCSRCSSWAIPSSGGWWFPWEPCCSFPSSHMFSPTLHRPNWDAGSRRVTDWPR